MGYSMFKFISLKTEEDFKNVILEVNQGSFSYYKCIDYLQELTYYKTHNIRKNGVIAIAIQFKLHLDEYDIVDEKVWKRSTLLFCRDYLGINVNEILDSPPEDIARANECVKILYNDYNIVSKKRLHTIVFTMTREDGKLSNTKFSCAKRGWIKNILRSYDNQMKTMFDLNIAPKEVFYNFLYNQNKEAALSVDDVDSKKMPFPMEGETAIQYYMRIKPFVGRIRYEKNEEKEKAYDKLLQSYKEIKSKYEVLKEQEETERLNLARVGQLMKIIKEYHDLKVLQSDLIQGQRIKAARKYFDSRNDENSIRSVKFIDYALEQGKLFMET